MSAAEFLTQHTERFPQAKKKILTTSNQFGNFTFLIFSPKCLFCSEIIFPK